MCCLHVSCTAWVRLKRSRRHTPVSNYCPTSTSQSWWSSPTTRSLVPPRSSLPAKTSCIKRASRRWDRSNNAARFFGQPESDPRALQGSREALKSRPVTLQQNWTWRHRHLQGFGCSRDPSEPPGGQGGAGVCKEKQEPGARAPHTSVCLSMCLHSV